MRYEHKNKEILNRIDRIDIKAYVRTFLFELMEKEKRLTIRINKHSDVERIKSLMNISKNTTFKSMSDMRFGVPYWDEQKVDFVPSNLRRGYIFYFVCNECEKRIKFLYQYNMMQSPLCRTCCRITYRRNKR